MQGHSLIVSEPVAHGASLIGGLVVFGILRLLTVPPDAAVAFGGAFSVLVNLIVGCKINLIVLDVLGGLIARPISAVFAFKLLKMVAM